MNNADHLENIDTITMMARARRETKLQAFAASFTVTTDMGTDGQQRLEPTLEVQPVHIGNVSAVLHMLEAALELAMPLAANWKTKRSRAPDGIRVELTGWGVEEAARALATLERVVQGTVGSYFHWRTNTITADARTQPQSFSFISGGVLISPKEAIRILFGGYAVTRSGITMNEAHRLVPVLQLKVQVPEERRARAAMQHLFTAMFESSSVRKEGAPIQMELSAHGLELTTNLHGGTPREALQALHMLEACV